MHSIRPSKLTGQSYRMSTGGKRRRCSSPPPYTKSIPSTRMRTPDIFETDTPVPEDVSRNSAPASSLSTVATVADVISAPDPLIRDHSTFLAASNENRSHATVARSDDRVCLTCVRLWADHWESNPPHQACRFPNGAVLSTCIPCNQRRRRCFPVPARASPFLAVINDILTFAKETTLHPELADHYRATAEDLVGILCDIVDNPR